MSKNRKCLIVLFVTILTSLSFITGCRKNNINTINEQNATTNIPSENNVQENEPNVQQKDAQENGVEQKRVVGTEENKVLYTFDDNSTVSIIIPEQFVKTYEQGAMDWIVDAETDDGRHEISYHISGLSAERNIEILDKLIDETSTNTDGVDNYDVSNKTEQIVNGQKCTWVKSTFTVDGQPRAMIDGVIGSKNGEKSISILLYSYGEDGVSEIDEIWSDVLNNINFT